MKEIVLQFLENTLHRTEGPMNIRIIIQPLMSTIFAVIAGVKDAKNNRKPFLWRFKFLRKERIKIVKETYRDVGKVFILAIVLDIIYQCIVVYSHNTKDAISIKESVLVAFILAIVPYAIVRALINRIMRLFIKVKQP